MSWTLGQVKSRVRNLLDDPNGSYLTDSFIVPLIAEVYDDVCSQMESTQSQWDIAVVEVPGIPAGTPNMQQFQLGTGPLYNLVDQPERIDWKVAGQDPSYYQFVTNYGVLPDWQPQQGIFGWEFRSSVIWLGNCSINVDLRVRGEFSPPALTEDDSVLTAHPRIGYVVAYGTAALIATVRGNDAWTAKYELKAQEGMDDILQEIVRSEQGQVRRIGRQTQRGRGRGGWVAYQ